MKNIFRIVFLSLVMAASQCSACTGLKVRASDGSIVQGRTVEFGTPIELSLLFIPRNYPLKGTTQNGPGLTYKAKYASVGIMTFDDPALMDGINEKGLSVGTFYFQDFAKYTELTKENQGKALDPIQFSNWIVTQFATVEEVKAALDEVVIVPIISKDWGNAPPPFHYIVYDKSGKSLVIEPIDGKLVTYDNPLGVFTNSPTFDWQMTNLRNFINMSPVNAKPITIETVTLAPFGQGSGMVGLPGDFTPPSRFVRAAIFSAASSPVSNATEAIFQTLHLLNQFDIPKGVSRSSLKDAKAVDFTMFTCARDPQNLKYYFRTYDDQSIKVVDLKKFDFNGNQVKKASTSGKQTAIDVTSQLKG